MISKNMIDRWPTRKEIAALILGDVDALARRIAREGYIEQVREWLRVAGERHLARRVRKNKPVPSVREWLEADLAARYRAIIHRYGPIPSKKGKGKMSERVVFGPLGCRAWREQGDLRYPLAEARYRYRWRVTDHYVEWSVPRTWRVIYHRGYVIAVPRLWYAAGEHHRRPIICAVAVKSRGYSGRWVQAYLCGDGLYFRSSPERAWREHMQYASAAA